MIAAVGTAAYAAAPYVLPAVAGLAGRAVSNYIGAKGPAMVWDQSYSKSQNTAGSYLGTLGRFVAAPLSFTVAGEVAKASNPAVAGAAQLAGLVAPFAINAAGNYLMKPAEQGHRINGDEFKQFQEFQRYKAMQAHRLIGEVGNDTALCNTVRQIA